MLVDLVQRLEYDFRVWMCVQIHRNSSVVKVLNMLIASDPLPKYRSMKYTVIV